MIKWRQSKNILKQIYGSVSIGIETYLDVLVYRDFLFFNGTEARDLISFEGWINRLEDST